MRPTVKYLSTACASAMLFACADIGHRGEPLAPPAQRAGSPDDAYLLGRQQHMANRFPAAIASYQAALRIDPRHVNATNGLATLYAEQGDFPKAIALWRDLTNSSAAPAGAGQPLSSTATSVTRICSTATTCGRSPRSSAPACSTRSTTAPGAISAARSTSWASTSARN